MTIELEKEVEKLQAENKDLAEKLQGLQDTMVIYQTSHSLFVKPMMEVINNRRLLSVPEAGYLSHVDNIVETLQMILEANSESEEYDPHEKVFLKSLREFVCTAQPELIQKV